MIGNCCNFAKKLVKVIDIRVNDDSVSLDYRKREELLDFWFESIKTQNEFTVDESERDWFELLIRVAGTLIGLKPFLWMNQLAPQTPFSCGFATPSKLRSHTAVAAQWYITAG